MSSAFYNLVTAFKAQFSWFLLSGCRMHTHTHTKKEEEEEKEKLSPTGILYKI